MDKKKKKVFLFHGDGGDPINVGKELAEFVKESNMKYVAKVHIPIIDEDKFIFAKNLEDAEAVTKRLGATLIGLYEIDKWK